MNKPFDNPQAQGCEAQQSLKSQAQQNEQQEQAEEKEQKEQQLPDVPVLRRAAMDYLARREHSFFELSQKLQRKFPDCPSNKLLSVINDLKDENLQSDDRFAESYTRYRKSRGFGYLHIKADLESRKVSPLVIDRHLFHDDEEWRIIASDLIERKLDYQSRVRTGSKEHARLVRYLRSRGFSQSTVSFALQRVLE